MALLLCVPSIFMYLRRNEELKLISAGAAKYLRKLYPDIYVTEICRQKKSRRKKYFVEETEFAEEALKLYKGV